MSFYINLYDCLAAIDAQDPIQSTYDIEGDTIVGFKVDGAPLYITGGELERLVKRITQGEVDII